MLFYRELRVGPTEIKGLLDRPEFDRSETLRTQRDLLLAQSERLDHMIVAVDRAIAAHGTGETTTDEERFEVFGEQQRELRIAAVHRSGAATDSEAAMDAVEAHRLQITERFYECSHEMQVQLGEGPVQDPRFTTTYEAIEVGLTVWTPSGTTPTGNVMLS